MNTKLNRFEEGDVVCLSPRELARREYAMEYKGLYIVDLVYGGVTSAGGYILKSYYPMDMGGEDPMQYVYIVVEEDGVEGAIFDVNGIPYL